VTNYALSDLDGWWFGPSTWLDELDQQYGQPGVTDTAEILAGGNPWIYNGTLQVRNVIIEDPGGNLSTGLSAYNSVIGADTAIYVEAGKPSLKFSNSVLNGNLFAQGGSTTLSVPAEAYGDNLGTTIVGGIPLSSGGYMSASLTLAGTGTFANFANIYAFNSGTFDSLGQQKLLNNGVIVANAGTVNLAGTLNDTGSLLATNGGIINLSSMQLGGTVDVYDHGVFVVGGLITGDGMLDLNSGRLEFADNNSTNIVQSVTLAFSGSSFTLQFDGAMSVSDLFLSTDHDNLVVAASSNTGIRLMAFSLDTAHAYTANEFVVRGDQVVYTAA